MSFISNGGILNTGVNKGVSGNFVIRKMIEEYINHEKENSRYDW